MIEALMPVYLWLKAAHIIFVIFWIAGLFMLPRFYIYHAESAAGSAEATRWVERENRLRRIILAPALVIVWVLGLLLAAQVGAFRMGWFHAKFAIVLVLTAYHGWAVGYGRKLAKGDRPKKTTALRLMNEVPGIAVALIVILAVVKPF